MAHPTRRVELAEEASVTGGIAELLLDALARHLGDRALLVFTRDGKLAWVSPAAEGVLGARYRASATLSERVRAVADAPRSTPFVVHLGVGRERLMIRGVGDGSDRFVIGELAAAEPLTASETRALEVLRRGGSNAQIAAELHISVATVKTHLHRIYSKLGVTSRIKAALFAHGLERRIG